MNNFIDNQIGILFDEMGDKHYIGQHKIIVPKQLVNCPKCKSRETVNVLDELSGTVASKSKRLAVDEDKNKLIVLAKQMKYNNEITGYHIMKHPKKNIFILYDDHHRIRRDITRALGIKNKHLNTTNNNVRVGDIK
jgi:predicted nucleic-acid-binding Zn-ribbon protein